MRISCKSHRSLAARGATYVSNTALVKKGQLLVLLDAADAKIALAQARADLGQVERKVRGYSYGRRPRRGNQLAEADIASANAKLASAKADFERARRRSRASAGARGLRARLGR